MHSWDFGWHHQQMAIWWLAISLCFTAVAILVGRGRGDASGATESPEQALKRRYASGELDEKTSEHMLREPRK